MIVQDYKENEIKVGTKVIYGAPQTDDQIANQTAEVIAISEPDVWESDDGRVTGYHVVLTLKFQNGDEETVNANITNTTDIWLDADAEEIFEEGGDVEVIVP